MQISSPTPKISLMIFAAVLLYLVAISGQARMADGGLTGDEAYLPEEILSVLPALSLFATLGLGLWRAHKAGRCFWFLLQLFVFPTAYVYTLLVNQGDDADNSSNKDFGRSG